MDTIMDSNTTTPKTPPKKRTLPPFTPKTPMRINGYIPNKHESNDMSDIALAPGCTLIIRGVGATHRNSDPVKLVDAAITKINETNLILADVPLTVKPFSTRGDWTTTCYVQLNSRQIPRTTDDFESSEPRSDLLQMWMTALADKNPNWHIAWAPAKQGTDKRMYIRFPDLNAASGDQESPKEKLLLWAKMKNYPICQSFANAGGVILALANPEHVDQILSTGQHTIKGFPHPLRTLPARQVEIHNIFEMIIMGVPTDYENMDGLLEEWIDNTFAKNGVSTMAGRRTPPNEPETFVFHMTSWADTAKILTAKFQEKFIEDFKKYGTSLLPPQMLFKVNSDGFYRPKGNVRTEIQKGASTIDGAIKDLQRQFNDMVQTNQQQFQATQLQFVTITSSLNTVTQTISGLEHRVVNTQRALLAQSQEVSISRNLSDINTEIVKLETRLLFETDPHRSVLIAKLLKAAEEQQDCLKKDLKNHSREFLTIVGGPIGQIQLQQPIDSNPTVTATAIAPVNTNLQEHQSPPHGHTQAVAPTNRRRTSAEINGEIEQQPSTKKHRTNEPRPSQAHAKTLATDKVCYTTLHNSDMLIATHGDITDSVMSDKVPIPRTKGVFRGTFDNLRDLSKYCRSRFFFCRSTTKNSKPNFLFVIGLLVATLSLIQMAQAIAPSSTSTLSIYALNANGLVKPVKLNHINAVIKARNPQAFVIGETKTKSKLTKSLPFSDYEIFEEEGLPADNHHIFKWGIVVGIRKNTIQITQRLQIQQQSLKGRVIAIDVILPTPDGRGIPHRIIGCYAPWNPGETDLNEYFWNDLTHLCRLTRTSWTLAGDLNATVAPFERHSGGTEARRQFLQFLQSSNGRDLWTDNPDRTRLTDWTCRTKQDGHPTEGNIIDRIVTSQPTFVDAEISVTDKYSDWIPNTDHRGISARITHSIIEAPNGGNLADLITNFTRIPSSAPRVKLPLKTEKDKYETFREAVDTLIEAKSFDKFEVLDDTSFNQQYKNLTNIITSTASNVFGLTKPYTQPKLTISNPKIKTIVATIRTIGGAIRFEKSNRTAHVSPKARKHHGDLDTLLASTQSQDRLSLLQIFSRDRKALHKTLYAEQAKEIILRAKQADKRQIFMALRGSTKRMVQASNFVPLPFAINDLDDPEKLICDPEGVKKTTREYFTRLYDHSRVCELPKPWLDTPSVTEVRQRVESDKFQWPRKTTLSDFRAMIRRGNHRPSPGPDRWEKWTIKSLSDKALSLVLDLHNYQTMNSCFPGTIKDLWLTTIHKRGLRTDLKNWRGLAFSNFLANSPMTWLNQCLIRYSAEKSILPDTQVAAQPGVQTRDLMSYLAGIKCWANRHKQTVYAIQRDQMKGFDYLSPDGFYDAIRAYGLPDEIIKLDTAAQDHVRCFIHTAYGATSPIIVSGVNKQGGPASQLKSTFTTSMGHYYLQDRLKTDEDALIITTSSNERGDPHFTNEDADKKLLVAMVEATDDTYIFSKSIQSLTENTLEMERFQYAYGWQTQWSKSFAYILVPETEKESDYPENITFQSVSIGGREVNPLTITEHPITLIKNDLVFLRTKVDNPTARFNQLKDFIEDFRFPNIIGRLPITLIRKIIAQNVVSRCRALLSLQPVTLKEAEQLDSLIMRKAHDALGFPFQPSTDIATLPVAHHGFSFPSIVRINAGLAIEGLLRDLNHHIPAYRLMARMTKADWTCEKCGCVNPLDGVGLQKDCTRQMKLIPASWVIAQKMMRLTSLSLKETDQSYISKGEISLSHTINLLNLKTSARDPSLKINGTALRTIQRMNIKNIQDIGKWEFNNDGTITIRPHDREFNKNWTQPARRNWTNITKTIHGHLHLDDLLNGNTQLAIPKRIRQTQSEEYIHNLVRISGFDQSKATDNRTWASDGSMIPSSAGVADDKSITGAATGEKSLVMRVPGRNVSILQGEQLGLIIALVLSEHSEIAHGQLLTDHLNSVRLIEDSKTEISQVPRLRYMNGRSYYRWIIDLAKRSSLEIKYTPGHSDDNTLETRMNNEADFLATSSQRIYKELPEIPPPTFYMNDFTFHNPTDGWIETNIPHYVDLQLIRQTIASLNQGNSQRMSTWAHDSTPPPDYPYLQAVSAHSAAVQLYARSGQLATADILKKRNQLHSNKCRLGCDATESPRHLFVHCQKYQEWRNESLREILTKTELKLNTFEVVGETREKLMAAAKSLFTDSIIWPLHFSLYFLGQLPNLDKLFPDTSNSKSDINSIQKRRLISHLSADWHTSSIRLAGRIFGDFQKRMAVLNDTVYSYTHF